MNKCTTINCNFDNSEKAKFCSGCGCRIGGKPFMLTGHWETAAISVISVLSSLSVLYFLGHIGN